MQQEETIDRAFERFRADGDVAALGEVFDLASDTLFGVARHLARGGAEAEDLVQSTFLTAIEKASAFRPGRPVLPWLLGILALHARELRRKRSRKPEVDRLHHPRGDAPAEAAEHRELRRAVERVVAGLPEIYREVLGAHLGLGLRPEQIARRLDVAPGTVRVRLHRGLKRLRAALPGGFALGAAALLTPEGRAAMRARVLERAGQAVGSWPAAPQAGSGPRSGPARAGTGAGTGGSSGALWGVLLGGAGVLALAGAAALWSWSGRERAGVDVAPVASAARPLASAAPAGGTDGSTPGQRTLAQDESAAAGDAAAAGVWLVGHVLAPRGRDAAGARVFVQDLALASAPLEGTAGADGRYAIPLDSLLTSETGLPDSLTVRVESTGCVPAGTVIGIADAGVVAPGRREIRADFRLKDSFGRVRGTLFPPPGPDEPVDVVAFPAELPPGRGAGDLVTHARVEPGGAFETIVRSEGSWLVVALRPGWQPAWRELEFTSEHRMHTLELVSGRGATLAGTVRLADSTPVAGARLVARTPLAPGERRLDVGSGVLILGPGTVELERQETVLEAGGRFELHGLARREQELSLELEQAFAARGLVRGAQEVLSEPVVVPAPGRALGLLFPYRTAILLVTSEGAPVASARVRPVGFDWRPFRSRPTREELQRRESVVDRTDTDGRYAVCFATPASASESGQPMGPASSSNVPSESVAPDVAPDASLASDVPLPADAPLVPGAREPDRAIELDVHRAGFGRARVAWPRAEISDGALRTVELNPARTPAELVLRLEGAPPQGIERFRLRSPGARDRAAVGRLVTRRGDDLVLSDLEPGRHHLEVKPTMAGSRGWFGSYVCPFEVDVTVAEGQRTVQPVPVVWGGRLRLTFGGTLPHERRLPARLIDPAGQPVRTSWFAMDPASNSRRVISRPRADRVNETWPNLPPGPYTLEVDAPGSSTPLSRRLVLEPGRTTRVRIDLGTSAD